MERHMKIMHGTHNIQQRERSFPKRFNNSIFQPPFASNTSNGPGHSSSEDPFFKGQSEIQKTMKAMKEFNESVANNRTYSLPNVEYLQRELNFRTAELSDIRSNYWLIHKSAIKGVTGFYCRRCMTFGFDYVKNLGYDMTYEARHVCDEVKVKSIHAVSIRKVDIDSRDNFFGKELLGHVNFFMPGVKYLIGRDVSKALEAYSSVTNYAIAKELLGIPDKYSLFTLNDPEILSWINRVLINPDERTKLEEDELLDFLGKVKSSYAIFEIPNSKSPKMVFLTVTL